VDRVSEPEPGSGTPDSARQGGPDVAARPHAEPGSGTLASAPQLALAKLTLSLRITGVRADGYHLLDADMVTIDLADELWFLPGDGLVVEDAVAAPGSPVAVGAGADNLVRRALTSLGRTAWVRLVKRIPAGAGLGGGSADAAAVLRWAGRQDDVALAGRLGADVAFCLRGGRARVTGVGDVLQPMPFQPGVPYTLLTPPVPVSTVAAYRAWDALGGPTGAGPNDLEAAALALEPSLARWRDRLGDATGQTPTLAGSGSTWWVPGAFSDVDGAVVVRTAQPE
jgi:4-diphosphocytidyl-2-C-methyl-D-erythritol kinase